MYHLVGEALMLGTFATQMCQLPSVITNTIASTWIYRSLADYTFGTSNMYCYILRFLSSPALIIIAGSFCSSFDPRFLKSDRKSSTVKWNNPAPISLSRIEVAVDTAHEQHPTSRTTVSEGAQQGDKPHESGVGSDLPVEHARETDVAK